VSVTLNEESAAERATRRSQRVLFDDVAGLYAETRPGYPRELVEFIAETAGLTRGAPVLEIGCGTGQLTGHLAALGLRVTAVDVGASLIAAAREAVAREPAAGGRVVFRVGAFEDLELPDGCFELIIAGAAFHWIDPEVRFAKSARLLRPGGWLALTGSSDRYDEPLGTVLAGLAAARGDINGSWARPLDGDVMTGTGLFATPVERSWSRRSWRTPEEVVGVENTRALSLSWPPDVRAEFNAELRGYLRGRSRVGCTVWSPVTMAQGRLGARPAPC
jgi:SAM-dependent methyltransferase